MRAALTLKKLRRAGTLVWLGLWLGLVTGLVTGPVWAESSARIVSLNPSLPSILIVLGAADRLVGVDDYSAQQIEAVAALPRVGGLFNPSLEAVIGLPGIVGVGLAGAVNMDRARGADIGIAVPVGHAAAAMGVGQSAVMGMGKHRARRGCRGGNLGGGRAGIFILLGFKN